MATAPAIYAIDFGTSNSLLAAASRDGVIAPIPLDPLAPDPTILRSILYFPDASRAFYGLEAIREYVDRGMEGRLIRSIKKHLPSRTFVGTYIDERPMNLEDLVGAVLREMRTRANRFFDADVDRVVLGRPARFAVSEADDRWAEERLAHAARLAGFREIHFLPEPVAAARELAGSASRETISLIGDFGGGTSDYTVIRLGPRPFAPEDVLAIGGVSVAGDALDASVMRHTVSKHFGADVVYKVPLGANELRMPPALMERLCSPADLSILRRQEVIAFLRDLRRWALEGADREAIDRLFVLIEDGLGFSVFEAIEKAKRALSVEDAAEIVFAYPGVDLRRELRRPRFEEGSERETSAILGALDETLALAGVRADQVDEVVLTGGTAKVPKIARAFHDRFGRNRVREFRAFHSVVDGLARHARTFA